MPKGSIPRSVAGALSAGPIGRTYYPDGLTEPVIDALIAEVDTEVTPVRPRPGWASVDSAERRRERQRVRQAARLLAGHWLGTVPEGGEAA